MKNRSIKTAIVAALALVGVAFTVAPTTAEAGHGSSSRYSHRCGSCSSPIYQRQVFAGYDCHGHPIYRWVTSSHRCSSHGHGHGHGHGHVEPHDVISGIVSGIINAHRDHRSRHFGHGHGH